MFCSSCLKQYGKLSFINVWLLGFVSAQNKIGHNSAAEEFMCSNSVKIAWWDHEA